MTVQEKNVKAMLEVSVKQVEQAKMLRDEV